MGNFYTNITVKGASQDQVTDVMRKLQRTAIISPMIDGAVVVYDEQGDSQDGSIFTVGAQIAQDLKCVTLAVLNHDDDVLAYQLAENNSVLGEYNSCPGYFEGTDTGPSGCDATTLCRVFSKASAADMVRDILQASRDVYLFQMDRHAALIAALSLPSCAVAAGYKYIKEGEIPEGLDISACRRV